MLNSNDPLRNFHGHQQDFGLLGFDLDIENPLGRGTLANIESSMYEEGVQYRGKR